ncbi:Alpha/Beta hydrolase protein [Phaeosphaeriaceae sp. PMI808]|nr:Alpha/Beta hydrolase protein [Phaeosphaeriaceae sp. PMI808]
MKHSIVSLLALVSAVLGGNANCINSQNLTIATSTGTYTGLIDPQYPRARQFRAIPFAKPPVGSLRWLPPQKLPSSNEHHYATRFPPSCPQFVSSVISLFNTDLTKGNLIYNGNQNDTSGLVGEATSEDCLHVAVWTPTTPPPTSGFPVLFFMTGGGFIMGGIDIPWQMPTSWVERSQSHIVVTINYRLSILGFPHARGIPNNGNQNLGILDQRAALEWVRDNIAAFGGDPGRITQWGRSAGSTSTDIHAYAFREDPIAQGYWLQSGVVLGSALPKTPAYSNFSFVAQNVGCKPTCDDPYGTAELDCMRQVPFAILINFIGQYSDRGAQPAIDFRPVADERIVFSDYKSRAEAGLIARVPTIISNVANEWSSLVPWQPPYIANNLTAGPYQPLVTFYDTNYSICPTFNSTVYRNRMGTDVPVYRFQHAGVFPNLNHFKWLGAYHASDIPISFGTYHLLDFLAPTTQLEIDVSQSMQDHVLAFVKDPHNGPQITLGWKPMNNSEPNGGDLIRFGAQGKAVQHIDGVEIDGVCLGIRDYDPFP